MSGANTNIDVTPWALVPHQIALVVGHPVGVLAPFFWPPFMAFADTASVFIFNTILQGHAKDALPTTLHFADYALLNWFRYLVVQRLRRSLLRVLNPWSDG